jgi:hypothetical protein
MSKKTMTRQMTERLDRQVRRLRKAGPDTAAWEAAVLEEMIRQAEQVARESQRELERLKAAA